MYHLATWLHGKHSRSLSSWCLFGGDNKPRDILVVVIATQVCTLRMPYFVSPNICERAAEVNNEPQVIFLSVWEWHLVRQCPVLQTIWDQWPFSITERQVANFSKSLLNCVSTVQTDHLNSDVRAHIDCWGHDLSLQQWSGTRLLFTSRDYMCFPFPRSEKLLNWSVYLTTAFWDFYAWSVCSHFT